MAGGYLSGVPGRPFLYAVLTGAFGMNLPMAVRAGLAARDAGPGTVLMLVFGYGLLTLPFVALGLLIFGAVPTLLLRRRLLHPAGALVAALLGLVCGKLWWLVLDRTLGFSVYDPLRHWLWDEPAGFGVITALAWWVFLRRWLHARDTA